MEPIESISYTPVSQLISVIPPANFAIGSCVKDQEMSHRDSSGVLFPQEQKTIQVDFLPTPIGSLISFTLSPSILGSGLSSTYPLP